ncbi:MAG: lipopolysaccharide transport system ATP-binding protein [Parvicellaceae bacterium]|jgi:lipopolysaccharide transport system ATP-binding protein
MSDIVLKIENVSKQYRLGQVGTGTLSHDLNRWFSRIRGKGDPYLEIGEVNDRASTDGGDYVWALRDVDFEVKKGEVLGIIGKNGAGKSTLLKLLSQVTNPTVGEIKVKGRIASLLEVGTGFHPELTGRENVYLNGAILGMTKAEIASKFDEIVDFSGVAKYLDTPVKRYSSGMKVRLGFAVAAHLEPEILVIDEVLAVGDDEFQKKCLGKMQDVSDSGRTVLFVSHNMNSISKLCTRCILIEDGKNTFDGTASEVIDRYLSSLKEGADQTTFIEFDKVDKDLQIRSVEMLNSENLYYNFEDCIDVQFTFDVNALNKSNYYSIVSVMDLKGNLIYLTADNDIQASQINTLSPGRYKYKLSLPSKLLKPGNYILTISLTSKGTGAIDRKDSVMRFVIQDKTSYRSSIDGAYRPAAIVAPVVDWILEANEKTVL